MTDGSAADQQGAVRAALLPGEGTNRSDNSPQQHISEKENQNIKLLFLDLFFFHPVFLSVMEEALRSFTL